MSTETGEEWSDMRSFIGAADVAAFEDMADEVECEYHYFAAGGGQ